VYWFLYSINILCSVFHELPVIERCTEYSTCLYEFVTAETQAELTAKFHDDMNKGTECWNYYKRFTSNTKSPKSLFLMVSLLYLPYTPYQSATFLKPTMNFSDRLDSKTLQFWDMLPSREPFPLQPLVSLIYLCLTILIISMGKEWTNKSRPSLTHFWELSQGNWYCPLCSDISSTTALLSKNPLLSFLPYYLLLED
jgi:hypothetical protein